MSKKMQHVRKFRAMFHLIGTDKNNNNDKSFIGFCDKDFNTFEGFQGHDLNIFEGFPDSYGSIYDWQENVHSDSTDLSSRKLPTVGSYIDMLHDFEGFDNTLKEFGELDDVNNFKGFDDETDSEKSLSIRVWPVRSSDLKKVIPLIGAQYFDLIDQSTFDCITEHEISIEEVEEYIDTTSHENTDADDGDDEDDDDDDD